MNLYLLLLFLFLISFTNFYAFAEEEPEGGLYDLLKYAQDNQKKELIDEFIKLQEAGELEEANLRLGILHQMEPEDISILVLLGNNFIKLNNLEQAKLVADLILQTDPKNTSGFLLQGIVLHKEGDYYNSIIYFDKVLEIDPENSQAESLRLESQRNLNYYPINGMLEIIVRDSNGNLVGYYKSMKNIHILDHEAAKPWLEGFPLTKTIMMDGKKFNVYQQIKPDSVEDWYTRGQFGLVRADLIPDIFIFFSHYHAVIGDKGDSVTYIYSWFEPTE